MRGRIVAIGGAVLVGIGALVYGLYPTYTPTNSVIPTLTGTAQVGEQLTCGQGTWSRTPTSHTFAIQSSADGSTGWAQVATGSPYIPVSADEGDFLRCHVTAANAAGSQQAFSAARGPIVAGDTNIFVNDSFTGADDSNLTAHTGEVGATWTKHPSQPGSARDIFITGNRIRGDGNTSTISRYYASGVPPTADYAVEAELTGFGSASQGRAGVWVRMSTTTDDGYALFYQQGLDRFFMFKVVNGTVTELDTFSDLITAGATRVIRLEVRGSSLKGSVDGTVRMSATDTTFSAAGRAGVATRSSTATTGIHIDSFSATKVASPQCSDSADNDGDTLIDLLDPGCVDANDDDETDPVDPGTLAVSVSGGGDVASSPVGIACPGDCSEEYASETTVVLTATPDTGHSFAGWGGDCVGTSTCSLAMGPGISKSATATFDPPAPSGTYNVFLSATGSDTGSNCVRFSNPIAPPADRSTYCYDANTAYRLAASGDRVLVVEDYLFESAAWQIKRDTTKTSNHVVFQGDATTKIAPFTLHGADHITIEKVDLSGSFLIETTGSGHASEDIVVRDFTASNGRTKVRIQGAKDVLVANGDVDGSNISGSVSGEIGVSSEGLIPKNITYDNLFIWGPTNPGHAADCIHIFDVDGFTIRNSYFAWCESYAILFNRTSGTHSPSLIENNVIAVNNGTAGNLSFANPNDKAMKNVTVQFNTSRRSLNIGAEGPGFENFVMRANLLQFGGTCRSFVTYEKNVDVSGASNQCGTNIASSPATEWVNPDGTDLHLKDGAVSIGFAEGILGFPTFDHEGNSRPLGLLDAGAYERE